MLVLGIETTCDETAAAVVASGDGDGGRVLSDIVWSQVSAHAGYGGVVPEIAARSHVEMLDIVIARAMEKSDLNFEQLDAIAVAAGPGLIGGLLVGLTMAKAVAMVHGQPLLPINHLEAHALSARLETQLAFPYLLLLVSGGHTQLLHVHGVGLYRRLGTTVDDALGEAFDKTARVLGLPYPGGPSVERAAQRGKEGRFFLPRPMLGHPSLHFSFSGLKTALQQLVKAHLPLDDQTVADLCAAFQSAVVETISDRVGRAIALLRQREDSAGSDDDLVLVLAGGVASNEHLRASLRCLCTSLSVRLVFPSPSLCTDNGAMIAWAGLEHLAVGKGGSLHDVLSLSPRARWPLDPHAAPAPGAGVKA
ncbi:MAG: tRNA (adenosine(37)-N6)-threonylcarbamoyltransferase complex transferase subunit TsaD [Alphaproteobacteria bacterium]|nr:tRNA (adenosine(37)-N6)-threonylcarbamoyltransferase complex transferase subunit TsaD [Alphaproteobacteria bacterium]